jgi:hypothetical protein
MSDVMLVSSLAEAMQLLIPEPRPGQRQFCAYPCGLGTPVWRGSSPLKYHKTPLRNQAQLPRDKQPDRSSCLPRLLGLRIITSAIDSVITQGVYEPECWALSRQAGCP